MQRANAHYQKAVLLITAHLVLVLLAILFFRSIRSACQNLARPDSRVSDAVDVRKELDLRIGK